jgi:hypothetical protein
MSTPTHDDVRRALQLCANVLSAPANPQGKLDMSDPVAQASCEELRLMGVRLGVPLNGSHLQRAANVAFAVLAGTVELPR